MARDAAVGRMKEGRGFESVDLIVTVSADDFVGSAEAEATGGAILREFEVEEPGRALLSEVVAMREGSRE